MPHIATLQVLKNNIDIKLRGQKHKMIFQVPLH
jgi:hypothetical protein